MQGYNQGYGPTGYQQQPPPPPPKETAWSIFKVVIIVFSIMTVTGLGGCLVCVSLGASSVSKAEEVKDKARKDSLANPQTVPIATVLSECKDNEIRCHQLYKDKGLRTTGTVNDVNTTLGGGKMYVTLGSGAKFEIRQVQCYVDASQQDKMATLRKGDTVTITGYVTGRFMNLHLDPCQIQ